MSQQTSENQQHLGKIIDMIRDASIFTLILHFYYLTIAPLSPGD